MYIGILYFSLENSLCQISNDFYELCHPIDDKPKIWNKMSKIFFIYQPKMTNILLDMLYNGLCKKGVDIFGKNRVISISKDYTNKISEI